MFMLSLMQPSGLYELEKDSLEAISAQLFTNDTNEKLSSCIHILSSFKLCS